MIKHISEILPEVLNKIKIIKPMNKNLIKRIEEIFTEKLQSKTGWGKNEIISLYKDAVSEACLELIDKQAA